MEKKKEDKAKADQAKLDKADKKKAEVQAKKDLLDKKKQEKADAAQKKQEASKKGKKPGTDQKNAPDSEESKPARLNLDDMSSEEFRSNPDAPFSLDEDHGKHNQDPGLRDTNQDLDSDSMFQPDYDSNKADSASESIKPLYNDTYSPDPKAEDQARKADYSDDSAFQGTPINGGKPLGYGASPLKKIDPEGP